jgi:hypothetical protein
VSSSNRFLLSITLFTTSSCIGVEHAELPRGEPVAKEPRRSEADLGEVIQEIEQHEAFLANERDGATPVATAVLRDAAGKEQPALGMAVVEVNAGGFGLRIAAELEQGTHHVYVLDQAMDCSAIDMEQQRLIGSPDPDRSEYLGAVVNVRDGAARFERYLPGGVSSYHSLVGHPLLLVHARGGSAICGVFLESGAAPFEEAVSSR